MEKYLLQRIQFSPYNLNNKLTCLYYNQGFPHNCAKDDFIYINGTLSFDTYFNMFSLFKWNKYTKIDNLFLCLSLKGSATINILHLYLTPGHKAVKKILKSVKVDLIEKTEIEIEFKTQNLDGAVFFEICSEEKTCNFYSGYYFTKIKKEHVNNIKLAIGICTFKREQFVYDNVNNIIQNIKNYPELTNLEVFISDNAHTLKGFNDCRIHLFENPNLGGSGGFTRCMIESINYNNVNSNKITNLLLMDDDIKFNIDALSRTYKLLSLLKDEYKDAFIGGAMFRLDKPNIQHASGEKWYGQRCLSFLDTYNKNRDMCNSINCLENENLTDANYQAWWYCCMPMSVIRKDNLPYPFFVKSDDIEFSIRNAKNIIMLNGINVWHESFESKYAAHNEYYTVRNYLICCAVNNVSLTYKDVQKLVKNYTLGYICNYKYNEIKYLNQAINDFLKGVDYFKTIDGVKMNKEFLKEKYKIVKKKDFPIAFSDEEYFKDISYGIKLNIFQKIFRYLTLNGQLIPAKKRAVLGMWGGTFVQTYKKNYLIRYDYDSGNTFILRKNIFKTIKYLITLSFILIKIKRKFKRKYNEFNLRKEEINSFIFWCKILNIHFNN